MNRCASKPPMPFGVKLSKLWAGQFYLNPADTYELQAKVISGEFHDEHQAVDFIDEHGEWID